MNTLLHYRMTVRKHETDLGMITLQFDRTNTPCGGRVFLKFTVPLDILSQRTLVLLHMDRDVEIQDDNEKFQIFDYHYDRMKLAKVKMELAFKGETE